MTVRVSKPAFNLRSKLNELDKPSGIKGNELMRSETTQEARDFISAGRRNLFHNGACEINQRGTSFSSAGWTTDRWYNYATGGTTTIETSSPPSGFTHYLQAASATSSCIFSQAIELKNQGSAGQFKKGRTLTVSWYAKTTNSGGEDMKLNSSFRQNSTSGTNSVSLTGGDLNVHVKISETWARYSRTFRINVEPHSSSKIIVMQIRTPSGALGTVSLTGFQCEFGSEPTEFEHRSEAEELQLCQRYFETVNLHGSNSNYTGGGYNRQIGQVHWKVEKRAIPTCNGPSVGNYQPGGGTGTVSISGATIHGGVLNTGSTNSTYPDQWINSGAILTVDAEI